MLTGSRLSSFPAPAKGGRVEVLAIGHIIGLLFLGGNSLREAAAGGAGSTRSEGDAISVGCLLVH